MFTRRKGSNCGTVIAMIIGRVCFGTIVTFTVAVLFTTDVEQQRPRRERAA